MGHTPPDLAVGGGDDEGGGGEPAAAVTACDAGGSGVPSVLTPRLSRSCTPGQGWMNCST